MGMDMFLFVEIQESTGKWKVNEGWEIVCKECNGGTWKILPEECPLTGKREFHSCHKCDGGKINVFEAFRSHYTREILSGIHHEPNVKHIARPRGIPEDASKDYKCNALRFDDYHRHSYITLSELNKFDWNKKLDVDEQDIDYKYLNGKTYGEISGFFYDTTLPALNDLAKKHGGEENIRILFYFNDKWRFVGDEGWGFDDEEDEDII